MPTTPNFALRYPAPSAAPNVPQDIGNLASDVDAALARYTPLFARKTATESLTSNITLQNDDQLFLAVDANAVYELRAVVKYDGAAGGDLKIGWSAPSGATLDYVANALDTAANLYTGDQVFVGDIAATPVFGAVTSGTPIGLHMQGLFVTSATTGTLQFRWAQGSTNGIATRVFSNSYLLLRRVA